MLHKAWPPKLMDKELNEKEKDVILLKHLLTWSTWQGFLKFIGKKTLKFGLTMNGINDGKWYIIATILGKNVLTVN